ncbi:MAG TPA: alcohol dehydrogenase catalytic domain-containing protein [Gemmatimonadaceae bacterium]
MRAMLSYGGAANLGRLVLEERPDPVPAAGEVLIRVSVCGVCRTDLDVVDGRLEPSHFPIIPGHQVVGHIVECGHGVTDVKVGQRVGVAWIASACGECHWCRAGDENLCPYFVSMGCGRDGGYAELVTVPAKFVHAIDDALTDLDAAPLLCAGAIGWRALRLCDIQDGDPLGLTGFGASAHLVLQLVRKRFPQSPVFVFARQPEERKFALELGASWVGASLERPPQPLTAIIDTTPAWTPVVDALDHLEPGGRLVINAIAKLRTDKDALLRLDYQRHLWMEREIRSVANVTRRDVREMLAAAVTLGLRPTVEELPLEQVSEALGSLRRGERVRGARVLRVAGAPASPIA